MIFFEQINYQKVNLYSASKTKCYSAVFSALKCEGRKAHKGPRGTSHIHWKRNNLLTDKASADVSIESITFTQH